MDNNLNNTTVETQVNQPTEMTTAELKRLLAQREAEEQQALLVEQKKYIRDKDATIAELMSDALDIASLMGEFKDKVHQAMENQSAKLATYGKIRGNSKGGFAITNQAQTLRIIRRRDTEPVWDERAAKGVELLKDFLGTSIKKRDVKMYDILIKFLTRNEKGDLEYSKVMGLLQHENKFEDPRWIEGLRLIKEGYSITLKCYGYEFKKKGDDGKWETLVLNFSSI